MTLTLAIKAYLDSTWTDITSDTMSSGVSANWGMSTNKPTDFLANTGQMTFSLKNNTGKYTPGGSGVISADWKKGTKVKAVFTFDSQEWVRFRGSIDTIRIDAGVSGNRKVHVTVLDWMNYASQYPLNNPAVALDQRIDQAVTTILAGMPIQPLASSLDTGANVFPTIFNDATLKTRAYSEFNKLALSEFAPIYVKKDKENGETLRVESANTRVYNTAVKQVKVTATPANILDEAGSALLDEAGENLLSEGYAYQDIEVDNTMSDMDVVYGDSLINRITTSANPTRIDEVETNIYTLDSPLYLSVGEVKSFYVQFTESTSKRLVSALAPDTSYPTTLLHFDVDGGEELIVDEAGKPFDDFNMDLISDVKKFGPRSGYFAGNAYVEGTSSSDYELSDGDFTIDYWEYRFNATGGAAVVCRSGAGGFVPWVIGYSDGTNSLVYMSSNGSSWDIANGKTFGAITLNTWVHYEITRSGDTFYMFKNGSLTDTWISSGTLLASTAALTIGKNGGTYITACIDELRIIKGFAAHTAPFTPPTEPYVLSGLIYAAWTNRNATGGELTGNFSIDIDYGAAGALVTVTNSGSDPGWLTTLKINGKIIETVSPVTDVQEDQDSIDEYGYFELSINQPYQHDFVSGREEAATILENHRQPKSEITKINMYANRDVAHTMYFLDSDVGDLVNIIEDQTETDAAFFIQGMGWDAMPGEGGAIVNFWWNVRKFRENVSPLAIYHDINASEIDFGYLPHVAVENLEYRIWAGWLKVDSPYWSQTGILFSSMDAELYRSGYILKIDNVSRVMALFATSEGLYQKWRSGTAFPNTYVWHHFVCAYDASASGNTPRFFINGVETVGTTLTSTATASKTGEIGTKLKINNITESMQHVTFKDFRIYNGNQVSDPAELAAALYAETPYGDANTTGLLFRAFNAPANELSTYEGASLAESKKVIDDIGLAVGTPKNSPFGEAV